MTAPAVLSLDAIEAERVILALSQSQLARAAGISREWYRRILREPSRVTAITLAKLDAALKRAKGRVAHEKSEREALAALYGLVLAATCYEFGADLAAVRAADPRRGATADPAWRLAARMRQIAIYIVNTVGNAKQKHIAEAVGLTPAAVCLALKSIEDLLDEPAWHGRIILLVQRFGGTP